MIKYLLGLIAFAGIGFGQITYAPSVFVTAGASYDYYGKTGFAYQTTFGAKITNSNSTTPLYSMSTLEMTAQQATFRTGVGYIFLQKNNWSIIGLGDAGLATSASNLLGSFSGGGFLTYDIGNLVSKGKDHFHVAVGGRILNITGATVQPIFTLAFGPSF